MASRISDRVYVHQLNLTSADVNRKQREKEVMEQEKRKLMEAQSLKRRQKEEEIRRDKEMLMTYNPWGKPGGGAPNDETKRTKFEDEIFYGPFPDTEDTLDDFEDNLEMFNKKFGRPGAGAPNRSESGKILTQIRGDPAIRFQDSQQVRRSIENHIRYKNRDKENYVRNLDKIVQEKSSLLEQQKQWDELQIQEMKELYPFGRSTENDPVFMRTRPKRRYLIKEDFDPWGKGYGNPGRDGMGNTIRYKFAPNNVTGVTQSSPPDTQMGLTLNLGRIRGGGAGAPILTNSGNPVTRLPHTLDNINGPITKDSKGAGAGSPWGRPGAGAPFERNNNNGRFFDEKLGWCMSAKKTTEAKQAYRSALQIEMEEKRKRELEEEMNDRQGGVELASVMRQSVGGRPKKDPTTGELARNPIQRTDVTSQALDIRRSNSQESLRYHEDLTKQAAERQRLKEQQKKVERKQSEQHLITWNNFWGRPGNGAPKDPHNHRKQFLTNQLQKNEKAGKPYIKQYKADILPSKHRNRYDYPIKSTKTVKKEYEFKTPFAAAEA